MPMRDPRDDLEDARPDAPRGLYFSRRGNWFHDGDRVFHARLADLLSRSVARDPSGALIVTTGRDALPFTAEDAPLLVRTVVVDADAIRLSLSDGTEDALCGDVFVDARGRMRTPVRGAVFWALLSRAAQQALEPLVADEHTLALGRRTWRLLPTDDRDWAAAPSAGTASDDPR
jgi:hypothetical protein